VKNISVFLFVLLLKDDEKEEKNQWKKKERTCEYFLFILSKKIKWLVWNSYSCYLNNLLLISNG